MTKLTNLIRIVTISALCIGIAVPTSAEDTEIYQVSTTTLNSTGRPKVLIIFDDSGSMSSSVSTTTTPAPYDNSTTYSGSFNSNRIYWSDDGTPPDLSDDQWFSSNHNRCAESITPLTTNGTFHGKAKRWRGSKNKWVSLKDNKDPDYVDCEADELLSNPSNPGSPTQSDGYPDKPNRYSATGSGIGWGSDAYTFYSANYMNWFNGPGTGSTTTSTRIAIAQSVVTQLINANPTVDFGLMSFNYNDPSNPNHGGRVIKRIITNTTSAQRTSLVNTVNALTPFNWTPLCETTYEAYRLMAGKSVQYGLQKKSSNSPNRDLLAESGANYISPASDCAYTYIILMTDGEPSHDTNANSAIETLTGKTCSNYKDHTGSYTKNCLPEIAEYMANTDLDNDTTNGNQFAITYTIGFTSNQTLLSDTAAKGKGTYYTADNATTLATAFQSAITSILSTATSFTAPAVAVDTFSRTESRNEVFFAMFKPGESINWPGNIKRLNLAISGGVAILNDTNGNPAFDSSTGRISQTAQTIWSTTADGDDVLKGGVGALLAARDPATRTIKSNTGTADALEDFNSTNVTASAYPSLLDDTALFNFYGVANQAALTKTIDWARGLDVDDDDGDSLTTDPQPWILADMLHSRPIVVNYGALGSATQAAPEQRLIVGTNGGFLHMFSIDDGSEDWAFFPKELAPILAQRRADATSTQHVYGIDAPPSVYTDDGGDGTIDSTSGDKAYIYFGLRRGGRMMYALDISDPDAPAFLWKLDNTTTGFSELGQTWSVPVLSTVPGYTYDHDSDGGSVTPEIPKPVLIFGAGYDVNKDATGVGTADSMGRGIFIVDAFTGALVWSYTSLTHSVPAIVTPIDSNGDGLSDRIYFGDTGGNLWRIDMPGIVKTAWGITQLASFNGGTIATDRRFFNSPDVVRTKRKVCTEFFPAPDDTKCKILSTIKFDAVMIGSGDRTNPNATDVSNQFYMVRDQQLSPYTTTAPTKPCTTDFRCYLPLDTGDLYDASANLVQVGTTAQKATATSSLEGANGWLLDLSDLGEKALARSISLYGSVFFTTFTPDAGLVVSCTPLAGQGRLYKVDLHDASAEGLVNNDGTIRSIGLGSLIPDTPAPHFGSDKKIRLLFPSGGGLSSGNPLDTGAIMPQPYGVYWYREEQ